MGDLPIEGFNGERSAEEAADDDHAPEVAAPLLKDQGNERGGACHSCGHGQCALRTAFGQASSGDVHCGEDDQERCTGLMPGAVRDYLGAIRERGQGRPR